MSPKTKSTIKLANLWNPANRSTIVILVTALAAEALIDWIFKLT